MPIFLKTVTPEEQELFQRRYDLKRKLQPIIEKTASAFRIPTSLLTDIDSSIYEDIDPYTQYTDLECEDMVRKAAIRATLGDHGAACVEALKNWANSLGDALQPIQSLAQAMQKITILPPRGCGKTAVFSSIDELHNHRDDVIDALAKEFNRPPVDDSLMALARAGVTTPNTVRMNFNLPAVATLKDEISSLNREERRRRNRCQFS